MLTINLTADEIADVNSQLDRLTAIYPSADDPGFVRDVALHAQALPERMRRDLLTFKLLEREPVCLVSGYPVDDAAIGKTPSHWMDSEINRDGRRENFYLMLCCHVIGEAVAWATEQGGRLIHDVLPIRGSDGGQLGTSTDPLEWHTEDAFHPERMDYVALMCLRNQDHVATTYTSVDDLKLDDATREVLARPAYPFQPDEGNRADRELPPDTTGLVASLITTSHERVRNMYTDPERVPALFGGPSKPYLRVHPYYIDDFRDDPEACAAFDALKESINNSLREVVLQPGDVLFIDNFKSVHGRRRIPGHYDGTDRWLKRAFVVRDLRKTRHLRVSAEDRVVY
ncbi:guanitoxin biosynthesis L-enduracididine beta-hydroxylase GntD [Micromonospora sp. NPDC005979]|uniref:guanitoxin biosynthesis L-enduracididine beta-hydroxylase GntD n=1 Tax=Micromonospora sp. NPDC005979 TaxID=3156726 RepID=UPI0033A72C00